MPVLFFIWAFAELVLMGLLASAIGPFATVGLLFCGIFAGIWLIRRQQMKWLLGLNQTAQSDAEQALDMREGLYQVMAGILLFIPGFVSDIFALFFIIPLLRQTFGQKLMRFFRAETMASRFNTQHRGQVFEHESDEVYAEDEHGRVIEAELLDDNHHH